MPDRMCRRVQAPDFSVVSAFFLVGPTAVGKTAVAQWIAEEHGYEVLAADSMVVYRGMDIGTAKPTPAEQARARHHGLDLVDPGSTFSAGDFRAFARELLARNAATERRTIVVGGTGLYIKSLTDGLDEVPRSPRNRVDHWQRVYEADGIEALASALRDLAPALHEGVGDRRNPRRLIRALVMAESGRRQATRCWETCGSAEITGLAMAPELLKRRIEARARGMFACGLVEEVRRLRRLRRGMSRTAAHAIGYEEAAACLDGKCSEEEAIARTAVRTRQLAKRQRTWFRHQATVRWIEVAEDATPATVGSLVLGDWRRHGSTKIAS